MKIVYDTNPEEDSAIAFANAQANVGQGAQVPPLDEVFAQILIRKLFSDLVVSFKAFKVASVREQFDRAILDDSKLSQIAQILEQP